MTVHIEQREGRADVYVDRIGQVGVIEKDFRFSVIKGAFKFKYVGNDWMKLTYDENGAVLDAVKKPVLLMNVTARLTGN